MEERVGEVFSGDEQLTAIGRKLQPGDKSPDFELDYVDLIEMKIRSACLADTAGSVRILSIINSLHMPTCHLQVHHWEKLRNALSPGVCLYTISMDLPYTQAQWQMYEMVIHQTLSAHRSKKFGYSYGILLKEWRLLQRSLFVIDQQDCLVYVEYVSDQQKEPDYASALEAVFQTASVQRRR